MAKKMIILSVCVFLLLITFSGCGNVIGFHQQPETLFAPTEAKEKATVSLVFDEDYTVPLQSPFGNNRSGSAFAEEPGTVPNE